MKEHSDWGGIGNCSSDALHEFYKFVNPGTVTQVNVLTFLVAIFMVLFVVGLYKPHYRHRYIISHFFLGADILFLPILTYIISNGITVAALSNQKYTARIFEGKETSYEMMMFGCEARIHSEQVTYWVSLALLLVIDNTSTIIVADDREGQNNGLPMVLFANLVWTLYIAYYIVIPRPSLGLQMILSPSSGLQMILPPVYLFVLVKVLHRFLAFWLARRAFFGSWTQPSFYCWIHEAVM